MSCCQAVVLSDKPLISEDTEDLEPSLLEELLRNIAMLASVYHKVCCVRSAADQHDATALLLTLSTSLNTLSRKKCHIARKCDVCCGQRVTVQLRGAWLVWRGLTLGGTLFTIIHTPAWIEWAGAFG
jgi:hypothetical protein